MSQGGAIPLAPTKFADLRTDLDERDRTEDGQVLVGQVEVPRDDEQDGGEEIAVSAGSFWVVSARRRSMGQPLIAASTALVIRSRSAATASLQSGDGACAERMSLTDLARTHAVRFVPSSTELTRA